MPEQRFTPEPPIYTFRVRILGCMAGYAPEDATAIQREIEIAANHTLGDLGYAILDAFAFDTDHLWSFFLSGKAWDRATEYSWRPAALLEEDDFEEMAALFPEGSEMAKLATLMEDERFDPEAELPVAIDKDKLRVELSGMIEEMAADAPDEERPLLVEFAQLIATTLDPNPAMMSEALRHFLEEEPEAAPEPALALFPGLEGTGLPFFAEEEAPDVDSILIRDVPYPGKTGKKEFLFLFDYGDEWRFGVKLLGTSDTKTPRARYPRVTARRGKAPPQYPRWDEDEEWEDDEEGGIPQTGIIFHWNPATGEMTREAIEIPPTKQDEP